jgi:biotin synthase
MQNQITWVEKKKSNTPTTENQRWSTEAIEALLKLPFNDLIFRAQQVHREHFDANTIQLSTLLSIKTGGCPEDCSYCPQSAKYNTGIEAGKLMPIDEVLKVAQSAKDKGATRFCMGAAWRSPKDYQVEAVGEMIAAVKSMGLETCVTLGMLKEHQARQLQEAGLDYYNHNLDTSPDFYGEIISTRTYQDRLNTLEHVRAAGIKVCCGGIVGLGETLNQRAGLIAQLANMDVPPESVPINNLVNVEGTPLAENETIDPLDFVRTVAAARITMPTSFIRLSAGRDEMSETTQALCFLAGANSIFYGEKLLVTDNPELKRDTQLFEKLGLKCLGN